MGSITSTAILFVVSLLVFCSCQSQTILEGSNGVITYHQYEKQPDSPAMDIILIQDTHENCRKILAERNNRRIIKKVSSDIYQGLIRTIVKELHFLDAVGAEPPLGVSRKTGSITIANEFGSWTVENTSCVDECSGYYQRNEFPMMLRIFLNTFDSTFSLHVVEEGQGSGADFFYEEQAKWKKYADDHLNGGNWGTSTIP